MELIELPRAVTRYDHLVYRLWFTPRGRQVIVLLGHEEGASRLVRWDLAAGRVAGRRNAATDDEHRIAHPWPEFSPDHTLMTVGTELRERGGERRRVRLTGPRSPDLNPVEQLYGDYYDCLRFAPDGRTLFGIPNTKLADDPWRIDRWPVARGLAEGAEELPPAGESIIIHQNLYQGPGDLAVSPDGGLLATISDIYHGGRVYRWRLPTGEPLPPLDLPGSAGATGRSQLAFSPDGRTLAANDGHAVYLCDPLGDRRAVLRARSVSGLAFTPTGRQLVTVRGANAAVWDVTTGTAIARYNWKQAGRLRAVAVAPDGLTAVAGGTRGRLIRWDLDSH